MVVPVHIVTYCSYRTTTTLLPSPLRYFYSSIDHTFPLLVLVVLSLPFFFISFHYILPLDHTKPAIFYLC
jgi:hypothetical protein